MYSIHAEGYIADHVDPIKHLKLKRPDKTPSPKTLGPQIVLDFEELKQKLMDLMDPSMHTVC